MYDGIANGELTCGAGGLYDPHGTWDAFLCVPHSSLLSLPHLFDEFGDPVSRMLLMQDSLFEIEVEGAPALYITTRLYII